MRASATIRVAACLAVVLLTGVLWIAPASGSTVLRRSVVELIDLSEFVVSGTVLELRDGFTATQYPYTEITLRVDEAVKGTLPSVYTFRQFGLLEPRALPDGTTNLMVTPDGWPRFRVGERVVLFLYKAAPTTGLRTTVGLLQGKFEVRDGQVQNPIANRGLFTGVRANKGVLSPAESKLLEVKSGPVELETFLSFVRNTVRNRRIERGEVGNAR